MPDDTQDQLKDVFASILENLAFMFGDAVDVADLPAQLDAALEASIGFTGEHRGTLRLVAPAGIADELAANILGIDSDDAESDEHSHDALGELMNITLGRLLTQLEGDIPVYDLTPPTVRPVGGDEWSQFHQTQGVIGFLIDDQPIMLHFAANAA